MTPLFLDALDSRVLVSDGAMGTTLYSRGVFLNRCYDELNLTDRDLVLDIHQSYVRAGADLIETNTFGANRFKLANFGLADRVHDINVHGARIARDAARDAAWVAGAIGPLGVRVEPWGKTGIDEAESAFREQASALAEGGVDLFILETFRDLNEILAAVRAVRAVSQLPIVAQMTTGDDGNSLDGTPPETFAPALERAGADVIGVNCSVGPAAMLETIERMARLTHKRLVAQPNAGQPRDVDGRNLYLCSPDYMASYAKRFIGAGVRLIGGCCGTTPDHIRHIKAAVRAMAPAADRRVQSVSAAVPANPVAPVDRREKSGLARALVEKQFVVVAEVSAPRGFDLSGAVAQARRFHELGALAVNVPDYVKSGARASALALSVLIEQEARVETVLHYSCRDHGLIGMQSDLVGAHAMGLRNVLLTTGDPARQGTYPDATSVFDVDAIGLTNMVSHLNHGLDIGGQPIGAALRFHIGVGVNPFASNAESEWRRLQFKIDAGAEFVMTPAVFDLDAFDATLGRLTAAGLPIVVGVIALETVRQAEFLAGEIGVRMPEQVLARLRGAQDPAAEGLLIATELIAALKTRVQGIHVSSLHGSARTIERVLANVRADAAPSRLPDHTVASRR